MITASIIIIILAGWLVTFFIGIPIYLLLKIKSAIILVLAKISLVSIDLPHLPSIQAPPFMILLVSMMLSLVGLLIVDFIIKNINNNTDFNDNQDVNIEDDKNNNLVESDSKTIQEKSKFSPIQSSFAVLEIDSISNLIDSSSVHIQQDVNKEISSKQNSTASSKNKYETQNIDDNEETTNNVTETNYTVSMLLEQDLENSNSENKQLLEIDREAESEDSTESIEILANNTEISQIISETTLETQNNNEALFNIEEETQLEDIIEYSSIAEDNAQILLNITEEILEKLSIEEIEAFLKRKKRKQS